MYQTKAWWPWVTTLLLSAFVGCSGDSASDSSEPVSSIANQLAAAPTTPSTDSPTLALEDDTAVSEWPSELKTASKSEVTALETTPLSFELPGGSSEVCTSKLSLPWDRSDTLEFQLWMDEPTESVGDVRVVLRPAAPRATQVELAPVDIRDLAPGVFHPIVSSVESQGLVVGEDADVRVCIVINAEAGRYLIDDLRFTYPPRDYSDSDGTPNVPQIPVSLEVTTLQTGDTIKKSLTRELTAIASTPAAPHPDNSMGQAESRRAATEAATEAVASKANEGAPQVALFELDDPDFCTTETLLPIAPFVSGISPLPNGTTIPYPLCTAQQYATVINTSALWSSNFVLMADIDLGTLDPPPSTADVTLGGVFEGNGYTLSNYTIESTVSAGVLGKLGPNGVIRNLVLRDFNVAGVNRVGALVHENVGLIEHVTGINLTASGSTSIGVNLGIAGIAGVNYGTLSDITATVSIVGATAESRSIGGLVGRQGRFSLDLDGFMVDCNVSGTVTRPTGDPGTDMTIGGAVGVLEQGSIVNTHASVSLVTSGGRAGGLVGRSSGPIVASSASGSVTSAKGSVGGLVGVNTGLIQSSFSTSSVSAAFYVGGLVGVGDGDSNIVDSYATGNAQGTDNYVGGLFGRCTRGTISTSFATGNVQGVKTVGGLVGELRDQCVVSDSWATGTASGDDVVGGLVGNSQGAVERSFSTGDAHGNTRVGGFAGNLPGTVVDSFATGAVTATVGSAGGFVGVLVYDGNVARGYAAGSVTSPQSSGGFVGAAPAGPRWLEDCHFNTTANPGLTPSAPSPPSQASSATARRLSVNKLPSPTGTSAIPGASSKVTRSHSCGRSLRALRAAAASVALAPPIPAPAKPTATSAKSAAKRTAATSTRSRTRMSAGIRCAKPISANSCAPRTGRRVASALPRRLAA